MGSLILEMSKHRLYLLRFKKKKKGGSVLLSLKLAYVDSLKDAGLEGLYRGTPDSLVLRTRKLSWSCTAVQPLVVPPEAV